MWNTRYSFQISIELEFSRQIFETSSNIKFHEYPSSGSRAVPCGQTDGRTDKHEEALWNFMKEQKNACIPTIASWTPTTESAKYGLIYNLAIWKSNRSFLWPARVLVIILTELPRFHSHNIFSQNFHVFFLS